MRHKIFIPYLTLLIIFSLNSCNKETSTNDKVDFTVEINFGDIKPPKTVSFTGKSEVSVLEALQHVALVETHPVGQYVFVTGIDDLKGKRGETAWYYKINGESATVLAINQIVQSGDVITWNYTKDVCSPTVDN